eukprot:TRINITY_DN408_c0_g1_i1.p1 TRINITY_DN408_c0_g1~~TRINITY_DN408_c0_g1_i1.p1  ORF type:complete len:702 (+),score=155.52 TRINITY_DN408_c0_g1_i1:181-2106(+)
MPIKRAKLGVASAEPVTVMSVLEKAAASKGSALALEAADGRTWTWGEYYRDSLQAARALVALGLQPGESVNIIGFNSPEWVIMNIGAIAAGGKAAGIYTTNAADACQYISEHSEARCVLVENELQLNKYREIRDNLPKLEALVMYSGTLPEWAKEKHRVSVMMWTDFLALGSSEYGQAVTERIQAQQPGHCCTLIYTSGTTGNPKACMISHDNITWTALSLFEHVLRGINFAERDEHLVSYLPLSHIAAQMIDVHLPIWITANRPGHGVVHFAKPDALKGSLLATLQRARPTVFFGVPRVWEKFHEAMKARGAAGSAITKAVASWAKAEGLKASMGERVGQNPRKSLMFALAYKLVLSKIHEGLGFGRCRFAITGAAPISMDTLQYFASLYLTINEVYGMSENSGPHSCGIPAVHDFGACGLPLPGCETLIHHVPGRDKAGEGEICMRGRHVMMGYMKDPHKTAEAIDADGWLHSGDIGTIDSNGMVHITGRIKELIIGAGGENIAPQLAEDSLKTLMPALSNAMMVGDRRKYNIVLLTLKTVPKEDGSFSDRLAGDALAVGSARTVSEAQQDPAWTAAIESTLRTYNEKYAVSNAARIQKFVILPADFSITTGELTGTMKLKRKVVEGMYADLIEKTYAE